MQLNAFRRHAAEGDHAWIARQVVDCTDASAACAQLHLLRGNACLRLAKAGTIPAAHYACAADALARGLALNRAWAEPADQRLFQENLCEALINLQNLQSGETARATLARLVEAAEGLYQLAPQSVPAVYYLARARLHQIEPQLAIMREADRVPACNRLKRTLTGILSMMQTAREHPVTDWQRFADSYQRLAFDLGTAVRAAGCR